MTTVMDIKDALWEDVFTVIRLIGVCFANAGIGGCICNFVSTLEPEWRKVSTSEVVRCENGDPFELIVAQLNSQIIDWSQWGINQVLSGFNNFITGALCRWPLNICPPGPFNLVCFGDPRRPDKCDGFPDAQNIAAQHFAECQSPAHNGGLDLTCYYHRVPRPYRPTFTPTHKHTLFSHFLSLLPLGSHYLFRRRFNQGLQQAL